MLPQSVFLLVGATLGYLLRRKREQQQRQRQVSATNGQKIPPYEQLEHWLNPSQHREIVRAIFAGNTPSPDNDSGTRRKEYVRDALEQAVNVCGYVSR